MWILAISLPLNLYGISSDEVCSSTSNSLWQVGIELGDIGLSVGDVRGTAEVVGVIEEDFLGVGGVCGDITIARLRIIRTLRFTPLDRRTRNITFAVELRMLYPAFRNAVVTQVCNDAVVTNTCIVWICSCTLHRRHSRRCAELLVILLTLLFYLHHAGGMPYPVGSRNIGAFLGLIETCIWLYMSQSNSLLLLLTEDYLEPCRSMLCPV